jgi:pyruvate-formate lyase
MNIEDIVLQYDNTKKLIDFDTVSEFWETEMEDAIDVLTTKMNVVLIMNNKRKNTVLTRSIASLILCRKKEARYHKLQNCCDSPQYCL